MVGVKQYRAMHDAWKHFSRRENVRRYARRAVDIGGTSIISFALGHVSRPVAVAIFLGIIIWLERIDPEEEEEYDRMMYQQHHPPIADFINRQFRRSPFPTLKPQTRGEQVEFWNLVSKVRSRLGMQEAA